MEKGDREGGIDEGKRSEEEGRKGHKMSPDSGKVDLRKKKGREDYSTW